MRILKKFIRKLYHLIWFLSVFFIVSINVNAETITYSFNRFTTSASNYSPQCNDTYCVYYNYPVSFNQVFTSRWDSSTSKTCDTSAVLSGRFSMEGSGEFVLNRDWLENHLKEVYISTNNTSYVCNNSISGGSGNPIVNFSCSVPKLTANPSFGYRFNTSSNSTITANATSIIYRNINISCDTSATDIIDNNNFNTDRIIRDSDRNSELEREKIQQKADDIINNQNSNTQKEIESQKVCKNIDNSYIKTTGFLDSSGSILTDYPSYGVTSYINVSSGSLKVNSNYNGGRLAFYSANKTFISAINNSSLSPNSYITIPNNAKYVRFTINKSSNAPSFTLCTSGNQALNDSVNDLNDSLTDSSVDSSDSTLSELQNGLPTNSVISDLLLLPIRLLQAIVNSLGGTCSSFNLGSLYGTNLVMPCINLESYLGSTIWLFIDLVFSGIFILVIRKKFIQIFQNITNLRSGGNEVD